MKQSSFAATKDESHKLSLYGLAECSASGEGVSPRGINTFPAEVKCLSS